MIFDYPTLCRCNANTEFCPQPVVTRKGLGKERIIPVKGTEYSLALQLQQRLLLNSVQIPEGEGGDFNFYT